MPGRLRPDAVALELDGAVHHWQLHHWCEGRNPTEPDDAVADWTGATLAVLHRRRAGVRLEHTAEWLLWRALGHRDDDAAARAEAAAECLARLRGVGKSLRRISEWSGWLDASVRER
jgi:hypothetical protein